MHRERKKLPELSTHTVIERASCQAVCVLELAFGEQQVGETTWRGVPALTEAVGGLVRWSGADLVHGKGVSIGWSRCTNCW